MKKRYLYILFVLSFIPNLVFGQLRLSNGSKLEIYPNTKVSCLSINDSIVLTDSSKIENNGSIHLYNSSVISEQPNYPIFGSGHEVAFLDSIKNGINNPGNLGFTFIGNDSLVAYKLYRFHNDSLSSISSFSGINRYYKFNQTLHLLGTSVNFKYDSTELNGHNPSNLKLIHLDSFLQVYQSTSNNFASNGLLDSLTTFGLTPVEVLINNISDTLICGNDSITYDFSSIGPYNAMNNFEFWLINGSDSVLLNSSNLDGVYTISIPDSLQSGAYTLTIHSTDISVFNSYLSQLHINNLPNVIFADPNPICENTTNYILTSVSPVGGNFSGAGVINDTIFPSLIGNGNYLISYLYTDVNGCSNSDTALMVIYPVDSVSFPAQPDICDNSPYQLLNAQPLGGVYSGLGVLGDYFDPSIGNGSYVLSYIYTNAYGCIDSNLSSINVFSAPVIPTISQIGDVLSTDNNLFYQWYLNGNAIVGETSQFILCDSSGFYQVEVSNGVGCSSLSDPYNFSLSSIDNHSELTEINVFPNPASNFIMFDSPFLEKDFNLTILNLEGKIVLAQNNKHVREKIDISALSSGTYFINILNDDLNQTVKINVIK